MQLASVRLACVRLDAVAAAAIVGLPRLLSRHESAGSAASSH